MILDKDNKRLVRECALPLVEEIENSTIAEVTELKSWIVRYEEMLGKFIRSKVQR